MTAIALLGDLSTGHSPFPPTEMIEAKSSTVFINGKAVALTGSVYAPHTANKETHPSSSRVATATTTNIFVEGKAVLRTGDPIGCGDTVGPGSPNVSAD